MEMELTFGEKAVGIGFNPGQHGNVSSIKRLSADLIEELHQQRLSNKDNSEMVAQYTLAIRKIQEGQMWGVKAATWQF